MITKRSSTSGPSPAPNAPRQAPNLCNEQCVLRAATTTFEAAPLGTLAPAVTGTTTGTSPNETPTSYILFTAYTITSAYTSDGFCITIPGTPIPLTPALSIIQPTAADPNAFGSSATSLFRSYLGFASCSGNQLPVTIVATALVQVANVTTTTTSPTFIAKLQTSNNSPQSLTISSAAETGTQTTQVANGTSSPLPTNTVIAITPTTSLSSASKNSSQSAAISLAAENISQGFTTRDKAAVGVVVPVVAIISFALGMIFYLRRHRKRSQSGKGKNVSEETQPYLQQKAELEAEEKRRVELEAVEVRYEMDGGDDRKEMPAPGSDVRTEIDTITRPPMPSLRERQELRGEEFSRELEVP